MIGIESKFSAREISLRETERTNDRLKSRVSPPDWHLLQCPEILLACEVIEHGNNIDSLSSRNG